MSLFQCENCGCCENTALSAQGFTMPEWFDWEEFPERRGKLLCSACGPTKYGNGEPTDFGEWHGRFDRVYLPMGEFRTNRKGNLEHKQSGSEDFRSFAMQPHRTKGDDT